MDIPQDVYEAVCEALRAEGELNTALGEAKRAARAIRECLLRIQAGLDIVCVDE